MDRQAYDKFCREFSIILRSLKGSFSCFRDPPEWEGFFQNITVDREVLWHALLGLAGHKKNLGKILDLGSGNGFALSALCHMLRREGIGIEARPGTALLSNMAFSRLEKAGFLSAGQCTVMNANFLPEEAGDGIRWKSAGPISHCASIGPLPYRDFSIVYFYQFIETRSAIMGILEGRLGKGTQVVSIGGRSRLEEKLPQGWAALRSTQALELYRIQ